MLTFYEDAPGRLAISLDVIVGTVLARAPGGLAALAEWRAGLAPFYLGRNRFTLTPELRAILAGLPPYEGQGRPALVPTCGHAERLHYAKGLCRPCYLKRRAAAHAAEPRAARVPACHPERPHYARGLCRSCYHRARVALGPR